MRAVIQRVSSASVTAGEYSASIERGLVVLVGVERGDGSEDVDFIARKIRELRLFEHENDASRGFDRSVEEIRGGVLVVSQFTLAADCRRGRRPSFDAAAPPDVAKPMYESVVAALRQSGLEVASGVFQAMMQVSLVNDGPVTIVLDSRKASLKV